MKLQHTKSIFRRLRGQGMSEYLVIVGMIAVAGIVVSGLLGDVLKGGFGGMANSLAGEDATTATGTASAAATSAEGAATSVKSQIGKDIIDYGGTENTTN